MTTQEQPRLIAFDLDGTLLNSRKELTQATIKALEAAAEKGIVLAPATGRFWRGIPEAIRQMPTLRYAITINGAAVYDIRADKMVYGAELPWQRTVEIMTQLDALDLIYDCYVDSWGWITRDFQQRAAEYVPDEYYLRMLTVLRTPVDELKAHLCSARHNVQKIIIFTRTEALQLRLLREFPERFPDVAVTSSAPHNIELNAPAANKGAALQALARVLDIPICATMAIGDGLNDAALLKSAGYAVAMGNAHPEIKALADFVTADCDHDGAAQAIMKLM